MGTSFHTPDSYKEAKKSHVKYEKRATETSLSERQKLFKEMAQREKLRSQRMYSSQKIHMVKNQAVECTKIDA